jgi:hypothetical protein
MLHIRTFTALFLLNDLRHSAMDTLSQKHKLPALLLFYSFIDICASLAIGHLKLTNRDRFERFVKDYALTSWRVVTPYDLWSARSSLLHAYSPLGDHTSKPNGATPIFYYAWPETEEQMRLAVTSRGYTHFHVLDMSYIKHIAISCFNSLWSKVENDPDFELAFRANAEHLLKDLHHIQFEDELTLIREVRELHATSGGG